MEYKKQGLATAQLRCIPLKGSDMAEENIVKKVCKDLGLTYKQLGEAIGYSEGAIKTAASTGKVSEPLNRAIELYLETLRLTKELQEADKIKETLKEWLSE